MDAAGVAGTDRRAELTGILPDIFCTTACFAEFSENRRDILEKMLQNVYDEC